LLGHLLSFILGPVSGDPPRLRIDVADCRPADRPGAWHVSWRLTSEDERPLQVQEAWVPHGRFRGEHRQALHHVVPEGETSVVELIVRAQEAAGTVVENAFLILRVARDGEHWRVFARMRVDFDAAGIPRPLVEVVTNQRPD
jgi:hypothetical protein